MSEGDSVFIRHRVWSNVGQDLILGKTITINYKSGGIVVALMVLLVSLAMSHLGKIFMFLAHQCCAKRQPADGLFRQQ